MNRHGVALVSCALLLAACGGKETMASRSAAAYREAQAKGAPASTGGHEHGHAHGGTPATSTVAAAHHDHAAMDHGPSSGTGGHASMQHGSMDHSAHGESAVAPAHAQHSSAPSDARHQHGESAVAPAHAQHSSAPSDARHQHGESAVAPAHAQHASAPSDARHQHGESAAAPAHAGHAMPSGPAPNVTSPPPATEDLARLSPQATLQQDAFDAPAPSAVGEAQKTAPPPAAAQQESIYACPMHPEVTSATPGTCPKCGMALVKKP